ncbi:MAG: UDP-3-O-acyl-N-acetylglucosamine deacetylase [Alphaproteobacteria bacterium]|nr:UDP-3-O-acyl-N-acetylglucosamine deacetylase [Alphaproteobacteria bacterium]
MPDDVEPLPAYEQQRTLRVDGLTCEGVGVHSGRSAKLTLRQAPPNTGIVFMRTDLKNGARELKAHYDQVVDTRLCTVLGNAHGARVGTVEHLLSTLRAFDIDNAVVEIDGDEVPIMDGSAAPFMFLVDSAGTTLQNAPRRWLDVLKPVRVEENGAWAELLPAPRAEFSVAIDFASAAIGRQEYSVPLSLSAFRTQIARARTFGFADDVEKLRAAGLARGGSLANAIVVQGDALLNPEGLRMPHEFARHKLLDAIGDLALAGLPMKAHYRSYRGGHRANNQLLRALFADARNYRVVQDTLAAPSSALPALRA